MSQKPIAPGKTIGILGGGQLGRMTALAAAKLGYACHIFCQTQDEPAAQVAAKTTLADFSNAAALKAFAQSCAVITLEWENLPINALEICAQHAPTFPSAKILATCQERVAEKNFCRSQGIATADFYALRTQEEAVAAAEKLGFPCIFKTCRLGYDGKGQMKVQSAEEAASAFLSLQGAANEAEANALTPAASPKEPSVIAEAYVPFAHEASIIIARNIKGDCAIYPLTLNEHRDHILWQSIAPAPLPQSLHIAAAEIAQKLAHALELVGLLCVEFFITEDEKLLVNELAPRPHNSGHWTMDACQTSQFEQLVRAITGLRLGSGKPHSGAVMQNLIGDAYDLWPDIAADPSASLHLYGKSKVRFGRKMGHVTRLTAPISK